MDNFYQKRADLIEQEIEGERVLLDKASGLIHQLNASASQLWHWIDGQTSQAELSNKLSELYDLKAEVAQQDVEKTIAQLLEQKLIE